MSLTVFGISKSSFQRDQKKSLYWLGHLGAIYQRVLEKILKIPSYTSRRNIQIRTLLNIFFDLFFHGVLFEFLKVAYPIGLIYW